MRKRSRVEAVSQRIWKHTKIISTLDLESHQIDVTLESMSTLAPRDEVIRLQHKPVAFLNYLMKIPSEECNSK